jgi:hypothetical protein
MLTWINSHGFELLILGFVYNSAVQALPKPEACGKFYLFLYGFLHALAANWGLVSKAVDKNKSCDLM